MQKKKSFLASPFFWIMIIAACGAYWLTQSIKKDLAKPVPAGFRGEYGEIKGPDLSGKKAAQGTGRILSNTIDDIFGIESKQPPEQKRLDRIDNGADYADQKKLEKKAVKK